MRNPKSEHLAICGKLFFSLFACKEKWKVQRLIKLFLSFATYVEPRKVDVILLSSGICFNCVPFDRAERIAE